ncbi:MAG: hypothetical protein ACYTDW_07610 [Planctomycetota bacterium]|jgi:hypothetical protein
MKSTKILVTGLALLVLLAVAAEAAPMGTAWTYQGRLLDANSVADGLYDFQFKLYDDPNIIDGNQVGSDVNVPEVDVIEGYFTVELDFNDPNVFNGDARWLEIDVRPGDSNDANDFVTLSPRTELTPVPYALHTRGVFVGDNTFVGREAGYSNTTGYGYGNTFVGEEAGRSNTTGHHNTFVGNYAGYSNDTGRHNTFLGNYAGHSTTSWYNTFLGNYAGYSNTSGRENTFLGNHAGYWNDTGRHNTFVGKEAGYSNTAGDRNVFIGYEAGFNETGSNKLYIANGRTNANVLIYGDFSTGNVGIGTTTPAERLHVTGGNLKVGGTGTDDRVFSYSADNSIAAELFAYNGLGGFVGTLTNHKFFLRTNDTDRVTIDTTGNVGIGTDQPESALDVEGTIRGRGEHASCNGDCPLPPGVGVYGESDTSHGVMGVSVSGAGVYGYSQQGYAGLFYGNVLANYDVYVLGNVGVGTDNPESALHVEGTIRGRGEHASCNGDCPVPPGVGVYGESDTSHGVMGVSVSGAGLWGYSQQGYAGLFYGNVLANYDVYVSGNVGIGTTSPNKKLEVDQGDVLVKGGDGFDAPGDQAIFYMGDTNHSIRSERGFGLKLGTFGAQDAIAVREATGNVGIGTIDPSEKLEVAGPILSTGTGAAPSIRLNNTTADEWRITSYDTNKLLFWNGSDRMAIDQTGNVGIGTTSPASGYKLDVEGKIQANAFDTGDITFRKDGQILWRMFEDEKGLYLEKVKTGKVYSFVLQETENETNVHGTSNLEETIKELQKENEALKQRLEALEKRMDERQFAVTKEVR